MERNTSFVIYGAGGHGKVLADLILLQQGKLECFFDDSSSEELILDCPVYPYSADAFCGAKLVIALGNNKLRKKIAGGMEHRFGTLIHPSAAVSPFSEIGEGTVILSNAVVQTDVKIGRHVIVNAGAVIDHDAVIEDFAHIRPNAYVGGGAVVKRGAVVEPGEHVERGAVVKPEREGVLS